MLAPNMLDCFLPPKVAQATQDLVDGICTSLLETRQCNYNIKIAAKHCILTVAINTWASFASGIAKVFGVHHTNVSTKITRRIIMCSNGALLWSLTMKKKIINGIPHSIWSLIVNWWVIKSWVSLNKSELTRKWLKVGIYDEKPTHFLEFRFFTFCCSFWRASSYNLQTRTRIVHMEVLTCAQIVFYMLFMCSIWLQSST